MYSRLSITQGASWCATIGFFFLSVLLIFRFRNRKKDSAKIRKTNSDDNLNKELVAPNQGFDDGTPAPSSRKTRGFGDEL